MRAAAWLAVALLGCSVPGGAAVAQTPEGSDREAFVGAHSVAEIARTAKSLRAGARRVERPADLSEAGFECAAEELRPPLEALEPATAASHLEPLPQETSATDLQVTHLSIWSTRPTPTSTSPRAGSSSSAATGTRTARALSAPSPTS